MILRTINLLQIYAGIRYHFHNLVKGLNVKTCSTAQLGLGHSYSRAKVKFNVHRVDNNIIHSIALVDQFDKDINKFSMRLRFVSNLNYTVCSRLLQHHTIFCFLSQLFFLQRMVFLSLPRTVSNNT